MAQAIMHDPAEGRPAFPASFSLVRQFTVTGGLIMLLAMMIAGHLASRIVTNAAIENTAVSSALLVGSMIAPLVQNLDSDDALSAATIAELDALTGESAFTERFPHVEIWKHGGLVVYSRSPHLIGEWFAPPASLRLALDGEVSATYADLNADEHVARLFTDAFLEIYIPIRSRNSGRIIAVAEIHEVTGPLDRRLWQVQSQSWLSAAGATILVMCGLLGVVHRAGRLIDRQREDLHQRMSEIERVSLINRELKQKVQRAAGRVAELSEGNLRRIGADLHDGPAQLVSYAALMVEHVRRAPTHEDREQQLSRIENALDDALQDIRGISKGLLFPEIEHLTLSEIVDRVVRAHRKRTNSEVGIKAGRDDDRLTLAAKLCVFRFLQEGLRNAYRHAGPDGHLVEYSNMGGTLRVAVHDDGPEDGHGPGTRHTCGLGLTGLRERVESLGGTLAMARSPSGGTVLAMTLSEMGEAR